MPNVRVLVRGDRCVASAVCQQMAPQHFVFNDQGVSEWVGSDDDFQLGAVTEIARACPVQAIEVSVDGNVVL